MGDLVALPAYQRCSTAEHSVGKPDLAMGLGGGHVAFVALEGDRRHLNGWHLSPNLSFIPSELEVCLCGK